MSQIQIAPSILAGDFGHLAKEAKRIEEAGADAVHIDVMDGHFVPNLTFGPKAVAAINRATDLFLDVHLMIYHPFDYIERFVEAGADRITFHFEATEDVEDSLNFIRRCNIQAGLALSPDTSATFIPKYLSLCDLILLMTVQPGFGGQEFIPDVLDKIRFVRKMMDESTHEKGASLIQVDGGIDSETAPKCIEAGANVLVAGTYLFSCEDMTEGIKTLRLH